AAEPGRGAGVHQSGAAPRGVPDDGARQHHPAHPRAEDAPRRALSENAPERMADRLPLTPEQFRDLADRVIDLAAETLAGLPEARAFPETSGAETMAAFDGPVPEAGVGAAALDDLARVVALSRPPSPRFFGYVLGSGEPVAALA